MARRDELAKRLAERLDKAPPKGRAMKAPTTGTHAPGGDREQPGAHSRSTTPKQTSPKKSAPKRTASTRGRALTSDNAAQGTTAHPPRPTRSATREVRRGHLIPDAIHADARRRKAMLRSTRGARVTWDDVFADGLALLVGRSASFDATLDAIRRSDPAGRRRRFVQATLPADLDQELVEMQLDLSEDGERAATFEQLWTAALLLWLRATE